MTPAYDRVIRAPRALVEGTEQPRTVALLDGSIAAILEYDAPVDAREVVDLGSDEVLLPGLVDSHVHVNDPGRTEWEGFASATKAAAAGGVTTLVDMPLNSIPPTVDVEALELKRKTAEPQAWVDVAFWGGAVPGNVPDLAPLHAAGVSGFKCFLLHSGVDEFPPLSDTELEAAMHEIQRFDGLLIVHAEDAATIDAAHPPHGAHYDDFLASRPGVAEHRAVARVIEMSRRTGCRVHILHVSSADVLPLLAEARAGGLPVTAETCPHYLSFSAEEVPDGATQFKCCPPIREAGNRERLWEGLRESLLDIVVSDHSPSTVDLKALDTGDFLSAWGGISSLQLSLSAVWTGARERGFSVADVVRWMSSGPAALAGLPSKGAIAVGADADFCVFAPDEDFVVDVQELHHRHPVTPYSGRALAGVVRAGWLRGETIDLSAGPRGRLLTRGENHR